MSIAAFLMEHGNDRPHSPELQLSNSQERLASTLEELKAQFVDAKDDFASIKAAITERWLRAPKASFVYSLNR